MRACVCLCTCGCVRVKVVSVGGGGVCVILMWAGRSRTEKKECSVTQFFQKKLAAHHVLEVGGWRLADGNITICKKFFLPPKPMDICKLVQESTKDHPNQRPNRGLHIPHTCLGNGDNVVCPLGVGHEGIGTCKVKNSRLQDPHGVFDVASAVWCGVFDGNDGSPKHTSLCSDESHCSTGMSGSD